MHITIITIRFNPKNILISHFTVPFSLLYKKTIIYPDSCQPFCFPITFHN